MPNLQLITGYNKAKAKPDPIFQLKQSALEWTVRLLDYRTYQPEFIPNMKGFDPLISLIHLLEMSYGNMMKSIALDNFVWELLKQTAQDEQNGYHCVQFTPQVLEVINNSQYVVKPYSRKRRTYHLSPPLFYRNWKIESSFNSPFWARIETDIFGHTTLFNHDSMFAHLIDRKETGGIYATYAQPFLGYEKLQFIPPVSHRWQIDINIEEDRAERKYGFADAHFQSLPIAEFFALYETTFTTEWNTLKALLHMWGKMGDVQ